MNKPHLTEDFFQYIWKTKSFDIRNLMTTEGSQVRIENFGFHNHNAGPDFLESKILIDDQAWFGNVEIHTRSSDWYRHKHHQDLNYNSVILHVAYIHDKDIINASGQKVPSIEIKSRIANRLIEKYSDFGIQSIFVPCESLISNVNPIEIDLFKEHLIVERLMRKSELYTRILNSTNNNWQETWYRVFVRSLGANINQDAFESLAISLPLKYLLKHRNSPNQIGALIFGQAGFLNSPKDRFTSELATEYQFLKTKYNLCPIPVQMWKFSRMRPSAFPTLRLAAFVEWILKEENFLQKLFEHTDYPRMSILLRTHLNTYWDNHYTFLKESAKSSQKQVSQTLIDKIIVNAVLPFRFFYASNQNDSKAKMDTLELFRDIKPEKNKITNNWGKLGLSHVSAFDSQALLHLYKNYCTFKACLSCKIGHKLINESIN